MIPGDFDRTELPGVVDTDPGETREWLEALEGVVRHQGKARAPNRPEADAPASHVAGCLAGTDPVIAASDYVRAWPQLIAPYLGAPYHVLGTDGFGRSDTRADLRRFFEVDRAYVAVTALQALAGQGRVARSLVAEALAKYGIAPDKPDPASM